MSVETEDLLLERQLCFALSVASRSVVSAYKPVLAGLGLTHPQYLVMLALWERSPQKVKDLGQALLLEPGTLSPLLKRLEAAGLVSRDREPGDERALAVGLTAAGRSLREQALAVPVTMMDRLGLDRDSAAELHRSMMELITAAGRGAPPAPMPRTEHGGPGS